MPISARTKARFFDVLERAGWTAGQQFAAVLLATRAADSVVDIPWQYALSTAAGAALVSIVATLLQYLTPLSNTNFWIDLTIRLVKTFLASLLGSFGAGVLDVVAFDWSRALDLAAIATLGALAKGLLAREPAPAVNAAASPGSTGEPSPSTLPIEAYRLAVAG